MAVFPDVEAELTKAEVLQHHYLLLQVQQASKAPP